MITKVQADSLLIQFKNHIWAIAMERFRKLPQKQQELRMRMYIMSVADQEFFPMPGWDFDNFEHYLSNILMKKKEHSFSAWLESKGYKTEKINAREIRIISAPEDQVDSVQTLEQAKPRDS